VQLGSREGGAPAVLSIAGVTADNDVTVSTSGGDYTDVAQAMDNALQGDKWCVSPTTAKPCIVHIAAGIYPAKAVVTVPEGVAVIGAGKGDTIIAGPSVIVHGPWVTDLTVAGALNASNFSAPSNLERLERVAAESTTIAARHAVTVTDSDLGPVILESGPGSLRFVRCTITAVGSEAVTRGITLEDAPQPLEFEDTTINVTGTQAAIGIGLSSDSDDTPGSINMLRGGIHVKGADSAIGIELFTRFQGPQLVQLVDTDISTQSANTDHRSTTGLFTFAFGEVVMDGVTIRSSGGAAEIDGFEDNGPHRLTILRSRFYGGPEVLRVVDMEADIQNTIIKSTGVALRNDSSHITAESSEFAGTVSATPFDTSTSCTRVLDGQLAFRPANCGAVEDQ
jgi:hypothetical protein